MDGVDEMIPHSFRRRRCVVIRPLVIMILMSLAAVACGASTVDPQSDLVASASGEDTSAAAPPSMPTSIQAEAAVEPAAMPVAQPEPSPEVTPTPHPLAIADTQLAPAPIGFDDLVGSAPSGPQPVAIQIENIGVADAAVIPVGVNDDLSLEVPPADQVGWYEYGSAPGEVGSAVLAAHIAYNGVDGVFRYLEEVVIGSVVIVGFDNGTTKRYRIEEVSEYVKEALPESLFARDGKEQLALITCGGTFNRDLDSYESNTVAIAVPI